MFEDLLVHSAIGILVPLCAGVLKPYLTADADRALVAEARALIAKVPAAGKAQTYLGWVVDALAAAWGV